MNKQIFAGIVAVSVSVLAVPSADARYDEHDAKRDCERSLSREHDFRGMRNVEVRRDGKRSYRVEGRLRRKGNDQDFYCRIRNKKVVDVYVEGDYYRDHYQDRGRDRRRYDDRNQNDYRDRGYNDNRYRHDEGYYRNEGHYPRGGWQY
jgi:hypothetical protein